MISNPYSVVSRDDVSMTSQNVTFRDFLHEVNSIFMSVMDAKQYTSLFLMLLDETTL